MKRLLVSLALAVAVAVAAVAITYSTVPDHTTDATHFDTLIVLGYPCRSDGSPSPEQRERVLEAVREFKAGRAGHMIVTGSAAHNRFVEAESMARLAEEQGIPAEDVVVEPQARNTIENVYYSDKIMQANGWKTAEVVSSASHLPRSGLILSRYRFGWRTHAAPWPAEYSWWRVALTFAYEAQGTTALRWFGFAPSKFLPATQTTSS
jgi:uncharacterized SAM-binding protein YcdF (DUF218 family)